MSQPFPSALAMSRIVVRALIALNLVVGFLIFALFVASIVARDAVFAALGADAGNAWLIVGGRLIMVIGIGSVPLAHVLLTRLLAIVESVRLGDPFVAGNAARLQTAAWALLGLELLHVAVGAIAAAASSARTARSMRSRPTAERCRWGRSLPRFAGNASTATCLRALQPTVAPADCSSNIQLRSHSRR